MPKDEWSAYPPWRGFYEALRQGDVHHVRHCLDQGMDVRLPVHGFYNALEFVASLDHVTLLKSMLRHRQFKQLPSTQRNTLLLNVLKVACKNPSYEMLDYLLSIENPLTYEMECKNECRRYFFDSTLGEDKDDLIPLLDYGEPCDESNPPKRIKKQMWDAFYTGSKNIRRQEILWLMKNYDLTVDNVCDMLQLEFPILLLVCVGSEETVARFIDQYEGLPSTIRSESMRISTVYDKKRRNVYEIAVKSGRADIVELLLNKSKQKLTNDAAFRRTVAPIMIPEFLEKRAGIMDINILKILPDEAFYFDGETVPTSESYHGLPWFFMGTGKRSDSMSVRFALAQAVAENRPDVFYFYMKRYNIPESHVRIDSLGGWYRITDVDSFLHLANEPKVPAGFPLSFYSTFLSRDSQTMASLVMNADVNLLQYMNQKFGILNSSIDRDSDMKKYFSGFIEVPRGFFESMSGRRRNPEINYRPLMPLVVIEHIAEYYKHQPSMCQIKKRKLAYLATKYTLFSDGKAETYELAKIHGKNMIQTVLSRFSPIVDQRSFFSVEDCLATFKTKRYEKGLVFDQMTKRSKPSFERPTWTPTSKKNVPGPKTGLFINSQMRERLLSYCILSNTSEPTQNTNYRQAKLIAALELHDFSQDFGPPVAVPKIYQEGMDRNERKLFFRDVILGLCGSHRFYLHWKGILRFLTSNLYSAVDKVACCQLLYKLVAKSGVVIVDYSFQVRRDEKKAFTDPFLAAKAVEHPDISAARKSLSLASLCRISVHKYLRRSPGFQSDKILNLDVPHTLHDFLLFNDVKREWDDHERRCRELYYLND